MNFAADNRSNQSKNPYLWLSIILFLGLLLRIYLGTLVAYEGDFRTWIGWGLGLEKVGFTNFYDNYWCDYMPGYLYVLWFMTELSSWAPWLSEYVLFKLPANLADLGISILIFIVLRPIANTRLAIIAAVVYFFNPAVLSNSTLWGQVDSFHAFPILLSIVLALRRHYMLCGLFAALAFMIKPQTIVLFPIVGFIALKPFFNPQNRWRINNFIPGIKIVAVVILTCTIVALPFIWDKFDSIFYIFTGPIELIIQRFNSAYGQYEYASLNTFNFWGVFAMWQNDGTQFLGLSYRHWGTTIFAAFYFIIFVCLFRYRIKSNKNNKEYQYLIFQAVTLILFSLFLFVTRAHERHLLPAFAFFTLIMFRTWIFPYLYAIVSGVYACNMVYSYLQLNSEYSAVPGNVQKILIPIMFGLYALAFGIVFINFVYNTLKKQSLDSS
ncbi:MAG: hypothetical protein AAF462_09375 [Thermodesulfobacteriota bacterium]